MALKRGAMTRVMGRLLISVALLWLALLMLKWGLENRFVASGSYTAGMAPILVAFPNALVRLGAEAWGRQDVSEAILLFRNAVSRDPLNGGAWLRLAEAEKAGGNREVARKILDFVHGLGKNTLRWTWAETLLALDLSSDSVVWENLNRMIENNRHTADALQLADVLLVREPEAVDKRFEARNLPAYMKWLIGWGRLDQALVVREKMALKGLKDPKADAWLSARLLGQKRVHEARSLSETGVGRLTNPGFEADMANGPFDWRFSRQGPGWKIARVAGMASEGSYSLAIAFDGKENASFAHLSQIVPVEPGVSYRLTAWWKGRDLSTNQGPFLEIYGHDAKGLHVKGPMLLGTRGWEEVALEFTTPDDCHAVVVRLRRAPSRKLDNKIGGTVWLDGFGLMVHSS
ncbi:MAG: hypothetical protein JRD04_00025 [Deltaproteobacteria bacterium]|nr:hypothetical protein [Deltaproteobacteria bacterium]